MANHVGDRDPAGKRNRRPRLIKVLLLLLSVGTALLGAELGLRGFGFSYHLYPERIEFATLKTPRATDCFEPDPDLLWVPKRPGPYGKKLAMLRRLRPTVVFMGCSCTQLGSYPKRFADLIEKAEPGRRPVVANVGVIGWSSFQGLQQLGRDVLPITPKVIVIYYGWNDHWIGLGIEEKEAWRINQPWSSLLQRLRIAQLSTKAYVALRGGVRERHPNRVSPRDFASNLREMVRLARQNGIEPVLVTAPSSHEMLDDLSAVAHLEGMWLRRLADLVPLHRQYAEVVRQVAAGERVVLCDLLKEFSSFPKERVVNEFFTGDGIHLTDAGNQQIALCLFRCFKENKLVEGILPPASSQPHAPNAARRLSGTR